MTPKTSQPPLKDLHARIAQLEAENADLRSRNGSSQPEPVALHQIYDAVDDPIFIKDTQFRFLMMNRAGLKLLRRAAEDVIGQTDYDILPVAAAALRATDEHILATGETVSVEESIDTPSGHRVFLTTKFPYTDACGKRVGIVGMARDITERKRDQQELQQHREELTRLVAARTRELEGEIAERLRATHSLERSRVWLNAIYEGIDDVILVVDAQGIIKDCNTAASELIQRDRENLIGDALSKYCADEIHADLVERLQTANEDHCLRFDCALRRADGRRFPVDVSASLVDLLGDRAALCVIRDISARKKQESERERLQRKMQHAQKLESLGVLAGGIAHDFNNLLMGVLGNAELALDSLPNGTPARADLKEIEVAAKRAAELCRQLLAYSGKGIFVLEHQDMNEVVREMGSLLSVSIGKNVSLTYRLAEEPCWVRGDSAQLRQVIMNLITNASDAVGEGDGMVLVHTDVVECTREYLHDVHGSDEMEPGRYVSLEISDTGCGMDKATVSRIFDPFYTTKFTGRGLGLAAVQGIARGHNGSIRVYSEPGKGSTFKVLLPETVPEANDIHDGPLKRDEWQGDGLILLADDEDSVRTVGTRMLSRRGFGVVTAVDGEDAIQVFTRMQDEIACVVLDLTMPKASGAEVFGRIRKIRPSVPVILSSGYTEHDCVNEFSGKGLAGFVQKPYRAEDLISKIRDAMGEGT